MKIAVLVSGTGSLLKAMIGDNLPISLVLADRPCLGLEIARKAGVTAELLERKAGQDFNRREYTVQVADILTGYDIGLVAMAGYMTVLGAVIFEKYAGRILNTHPALLPAFKGNHAVRDALAAGVKVTGCTIHVATERLDDGKILAQEPVRVMPFDTEETLWERIKQVERRLYLDTIRAYIKTLE